MNFFQEQEKICCFRVHTRTFSSQSLYSEIKFPVCTYIYTENYHWYGHSGRKGIVLQRHLKGLENSFNLQQHIAIDFVEALGNICANYVDLTVWSGPEQNCVAFN